MSTEHFRSTGRYYDCMFWIIYISALMTFAPAHDIHLSVTEVSRSGEKIEVVSKIFLDDLQTSMGLVPGEELPEDYIGAEDLIQRFMNRSLSVVVNGIEEKLTLSYIEPALPAVWATFVTDTIIWKNKNLIAIDNKIMTDLFDDQRNIIKVDINGVKEEHVLTSKATTKTIKL